MLQARKKPLAHLVPCYIVMLIVGHPGSAEARLVRYKKPVFVDCNSS